MITFAELYQTAILHKGGEENVIALLPKVKTAKQLAQKEDAYYLSTMSLRIFRAGLKHSLVDAKWPEFERVFKGFDTHYCAMLSDDDMDELMSNKALIRHLGKMKSVRENAQFVRRVSDERGGFGAWLAAWPVEDVVGLWLALKKQGKQLGGNSGPYFLRMVGRDTFLLTSDVINLMMAHGVVSRAPSSQKDMREVERVFLEWQQQSGGRPLCEISRIASMAVAI
ncbi:DNA-3-methyladenine glycosylase I [Alteromonadaceae bacterium Bs31]|nr:DNA-3-methyladenine glycosylase I [Alteromonadaceae bacterium Bs31]